MFHDFFANTGFPFGGSIFWILIIALIIWAITGNSKRHNPLPPPSHPNETALDILKKRYAKGEITKEQFEEMKKDVL